MATNQSLLGISGQVDLLSATPTQLPDKPTIGNGMNFALTAHPDNVDTIYIGGSDVSATNGFPLEPSHGITVNISELSRLYAIADVDADKVTWLKLCGSN